jgi:hypothetical protein
VGGYVGDVGTHLPDPFDRIFRLVGRRSHPVDWPKSFDSFDAYAVDDEFLLTLHYKALKQLLDGATLPHSVLIEFEGNADNNITVPPSCTFDLTIRLNFGDGHHIDNPDIIRSKAEMMQILSAALTSP